VPTKVPGCVHRGGSIRLGDGELGVNPPVTDASVPNPALDRSGSERVYAGAVGARGARAATAFGNASTKRAMSEGGLENEARMKRPPKVGER
jgi:hypothetical protein